MVLSKTRSYCNAGIVVGANPSTTIELVGSKDVSVNGYGNKAQVTALQCVSADGDLLKAQRIYPGTMNFAA